MDELVSAANELSEFVEPLWREWKEQNPSLQGGESLSFGMCRFTSAFAGPILNRQFGLRLKPFAGFTNFHPADPGWDKRHGKPASTFKGQDGVGGMLGTDGLWHEHYWLSDGITIVDLTAEQFGWEPVIVAAGEDPRYLANWKPSAVTSHMRDVTLRAKGWQELWLERRNPPAPPRL